MLHHNFSWDSVGLNAFLKKRHNQLLTYKRYLQGERKIRGHSHINLCESFSLWTVPTFIGLAP